MSRIDVFDDPSVSTRAPVRWIVSLAAGCLWLLGVMVLEWRNPRLVPSWHGFLHSAIVTRFPTTSLPPENPFFAGEPLPYYWAYHGLGAIVARLTGLSPLAALQCLTLGSLVVLVVSAIDVGRRLTGSSAAGVLVGCLALAGANPLGPIIAGSRVLINHERLVVSPPAEPVESVFVTDRMADDFMSQPLLGALYFGRDWRSGQNLVWFWDISSRGPALAALMIVIWMFVRGSRIGVGASAFVLTALNPLIGVMVAISLSASLAGLGLLGRRSGQRRSMPMAARTIVPLTVGVLFALPTFFHLFSYGGIGGLSPGRWMAVKTGSLVLNYFLIAALAIWSSTHMVVDERHVVRGTTVAGLCLLVLAVVLGLTEGDEHNLVNSAAVLLAVPAGISPWKGRPVWLPHWGHAPAAFAIAVIFLPMTAATFMAFDHRPSIPLRYTNRLERVPKDGALGRLYEWIRRETPHDAVLVTDPDRPIKMSGNASELPAFTDRTLFVDHSNYLTRPNAQFSERTRMAKALLAGESVSTHDCQLLHGLSRPIYIIVTDADGRASVEGRHGPPVFTSSVATVFRLTC